MTDKPLSIEERISAVALEALREYDQIVRFVSHQRELGVERDLKHNRNIFVRAIHQSLRRYFGDLARPGLMPSCHICGKPMKGVCESCGATTGVAPAESQPPLRASIPEGRTVSNVSISGEKVGPSQLPRTATSSNQRLGYLESDLPSDPLCRIEGCGKPLRYHIDMGRHNSHSFDITRERRIGAKERRVWDTGSWASREKRSSLFVPYQRTGPPDRRQMPSQDSAIGDETPAQPGKKEAQVCNDCKGVYGTWFAPNEIWNAVVYDRVAGMLCPNCFMFRAGLYGLMVTWELRPADYRSPAACECESPMPSWNPDWRFCLKCGGRMASDSHAPRGNAAQPGKKEGESTDAPSTVLPLRNVQDHGESTARAAGTSVTSAAPPRCVTAEAVKAYRHRLMHRDNATKTAPLSSWSDAEVAAFASSLLAEREATIAELELNFQAMQEVRNEECDRHSRAETTWKQRAEQAEQERDALKGSTWGAAYEVTQKAVATAERLRGLLREWYLHYLNNGEWDELPLALRQRIQKELEGRP